MEPINPAASIIKLRLLGMVQTLRLCVSPFEGADERSSTFPLLEGQAVLFGDEVCAGIRQGETWPCLTFQRAEGSVCAANVALPGRGRIPMKNIGMVTIGKAAMRAGVSTKTIRFYEEAGLIKAVERGSNRYRSYSQADIEMLRFVRRARTLGFSLKDVASLLELYSNHKRASRDVKRLALRHVADLDRKLAELTAIRDTIAELARRCHGNDRPDCPILDELQSRPPSANK
jgi:MerR family copper efflux transcriptional regulator